MKNRTIRWIYIKTALLSALAALVVALRVDYDWGSGYALGALLGLFNWFFLGYGLVSLTERRPLGAMVAVLGKIIVLATLFFFILPSAPQITLSFIAGFSTFLLVVVLEAVGFLISASLKKNAGDRQLPENLRTLLLGPSKDG